MNKPKKKIDLNQGHVEAFGLRPNMDRISMFKLGDLSPGKYQPRTKFEKAKLLELAESIKKYGVLQPIIVEEDKEDSRRYRIIVGERRWRASELAGLDEIPGILKADVDSAEISLIENVQREDLSPLEEALGYKSLMELRNYNQEQLGDVVGKKRTTINEILSITKLPGDILEELVDYPNVSKTHLIIIAQEKDPAKQRSLWARARSGLLTTRDTVQVRKGKTATSELSPSERVIRLMSGAVNKLEKLDTLDAMSVVELKKLRGRINKALKEKGDK